MKKKYLMIAFIGCSLIILGLISNFVLTITNQSPLELTEAYLKKYQTAKESVIKDTSYPFQDTLDQKQQQRYIALLKKQYQQLTYEIAKKEVKEKEAMIEVSITVIDFTEAYRNATQYITLHKEKFQKDGKFNDALAIDYKLEQLEKATTKISFGLNFLFKKNRGWKMIPLEETDLKRLQGVY